MYQIGFHFILLHCNLTIKSEKISVRIRLSFFPSQNHFNSGVKIFIFTIYLIWLKWWIMSFSGIFLTTVKLIHDVPRNWNYNIPFSIIINAVLLLSWLKHHLACALPTQATVNHQYGWARDGHTVWPIVSSAYALAPVFLRWQLPFQPSCTK